MPWLIKERRGGEKVWSLLSPTPGRRLWFWVASALPSRAEWLLTTRAERPGPESGSPCSAFSACSAPNPFKSCPSPHPLVYFNQGRNWGLSPDPPPHVLRAQANCFLSFLLGIVFGALSSFQPPWGVGVGEWSERGRIWLTIGLASIPPWGLRPHPGSAGSAQ